MRKKSASRSAFFNPRILISLFIVLAGVLLALASSGVFSATAQSVLKAMTKGKIITSSTDPLVPVGFDCSTIHEKGIDKQENFRAGAIMIACGEVSGSATSATSTLGPVGHFIKKLLMPLAYGAGDVDLVTGTETSPNITQSETYTLANPDNPLQIVAAYNDSRGRNVSPINISGASVSTDGGTTFTRLTLGSGQGPFSNTVGDPVVLFHKPTGTWFTVWLDGACGGQGLGGYKTTTPEVAASWTHFTCVHSNSSDDRESGWSDNNLASPYYGRMYVSWNDFNVGGGALFVTYSNDAGATWAAPVVVSNTSTFIRDVQITGDLSGNGVVYIAGMDEGGGGFPHNNINKIFKSTNGGVSWTNTYTGSAFAGPGVTAVGYFACMFTDGGGFWRHEGWGEPAAYNNVVHLVYAQHGAGSDAGDVYYIRSADGGVTFGAPFKLNTDATTRSQWQPNISVSPTGTLLATWYDGRESASCTRGSPGVPCYRMWSRKSNDNGASWLPDDAFSDAVSPLPAQPDPGIQATYAGDYDYGSATAGKHVTSWVDGRVAISGASQQDAFTDRELVGFAVTTSNPACNSTINTTPTDFVVNLSDPVNTGTVQANDFMVNGTPSNLAPTFSNGNATITFHFSSTPVIMQGVQTMHIPANAFNRASDNQGNFEFQCSFCYAVMPLQVTTTSPPVGGTFSPSAPGNYQYDVNFNQAVDPGSVQTSDLTLTGAVGGSVTSVMLINGNQTARFTLHFNFGGSVTASIGAGSITAAGCNANAAFSGNYTVDGCPPSDHYTISSIAPNFVPGTTDIGNFCDDCTTTIPLPFNYTLYDQTFSSIILSSNGVASFSTDAAPYINECLPSPSYPTYTIFPYWDDLYNINGGYGIFTTVEGLTPNRIFDIEFRSQYYPGSGTANFELKLYEGQTRFDVVYQSVTSGNAGATAGVQKDGSAFDQYFCNGSGSSATGAQSYILQACTPSPTPTPTPTATATATATPTATATFTPTATATFTPTATATFTPTATATFTPTATATFTPTATATFTPTATATFTPTATATFTPTATATSTPTATATFTPTATATFTPTATATFTPTATATFTPTATATATTTATATATPVGITLTANGYKVRGFDTVDLLWGGATSASVDIKRNGLLVATVLNTPSMYTDDTGQKGSAAFTYQVCEAGTQNCSNLVTVTFGNATPPPTPTATPSPSPSVTPSATPSPSGITLSANGYKVQGVEMVDLSWGGATSLMVDIKRNSTTIATVPSTPGNYHDNTGQKGRNTFTYQVCEAGTSTCSSLVTVNF